MNIIPSKHICDFSWFNTSLEIIDILKKFALGISYKDVLVLYEALAMDDVKTNSTCLDELANGFPGTAILGNDDTSICADTSHPTNDMLVHPDDVVPLDSEDDRSGLQLTKPEDMKTLSFAQHKIHPYKTFKQRQPAVRKKVGVSLQTSDAQRKQAVM